MPLPRGYIIMDTWLGNARFEGGPPARDATSVYDWVKFYANFMRLPIKRPCLPLGSEHKSA